MASSTANPAPLSGDLAGTLKALQTEVAALRQSLSLMLETQATHTEMLRQVLEAASAPVPGEGSLTETLSRISAALTQYANGLGAIRTVLERLPADVGAAVAQAMRDTLPRG